MSYCIDERQSWSENDDDWCEAHDTETGATCCREIDHSGPHQSSICNGTCDTCDCIEWSDAPPITVEMPVAGSPAREDRAE